MFYKQDTPLEAKRPVLVRRQPVVVSRKLAIRKAVVFQLTVFGL